MSDGAGRPDSSLGTIYLDDTFEKPFRDGRTNAIIAWVLVAILTAVFVESVLDIDYQWTLLVGVVSAVVLVPLVAYRKWRVMLPWELLFVACRSWSAALSGPSTFTTI